MLLSLGFILSWLALHLVMESILKKLLGFLPCGFLGEIFVLFLCCCACLYFSDLIAYSYDVMMLNLFRSCITIKILTLTYGFHM